MGNPDAWTAATGPKFPVMGLHFIQPRSGHNRLAVGDQPTVIEARMVEKPRSGDRRCVSFRGNPAFPRIRRWSLHRHPPVVRAVWRIPFAICILHATQPFLAGNRAFVLGGTREHPTRISCQHRDMMTHAWRALRRPNLGMADSISDMIATEEWRSPGLLTDLRASPTLLVASDYGGEHASAYYQTISLLVADMRGVVASWDLTRRKLRSRFASDGRRLSYKKLGDRQRARMLLPFLAAANQLPGVIATFLIDRRIETFFSSDIDITGELVIDSTYWKPKAFEKLLRVAHFGSLLIAGMSSQGQNILWITDQDAITANLKKHTEATKVIASVLSGYLSHSVGHIRIGTAQSDDGSLNIEDLLAIPDVVAGAWAEVSSHVARRFGRLAHPVHVMATKNLLRKAHEILLWHSEARHSLKRIAFVIEHVPPDRFKAHMIHSLVETSTVIA